MKTKIITAFFIALFAVGSVFADNGYHEIKVQFNEHVYESVTYFDANSNEDNCTDEDWLDIIKENSSPETINYASQQFKKMGWKFGNFYHGTFYFKELPKGYEYQLLPKYKVTLFIYMSYDDGTGNYRCYYYGGKTRDGYHIVHFTNNELLKEKK